MTGKKVQLTKEFTIFDNSIDPNPVFRSFLLQLLLRTRYDVLAMNYKTQVGLLS